MMTIEDLQELQRLCEWMSTQKDISPEDEAACHRVGAFAEATRIDQQVIEKEDV